MSTSGRSDDQPLPLQLRINLVEIDNSAQLNSTQTAQSDSESLSSIVKSDHNKIEQFIKDTKEADLLELVESLLPAMVDSAETVACATKTATASAAVGSGGGPFTSGRNDSGEQIDRPRSVNTGNNQSNSDKNNNSIKLSEHGCLVNDMRKQPLQSESDGDSLDTPETACNKSNRRIGTGSGSSNDSGITLVDSNNNEFTGTFKVFVCFQNSS